MKQIESCAFNIGTACVEVKYADGSILAVDTIQVENAIPANRYENRMLDYLIYNSPLEYVELVFSGEIKGYLKENTDYRPIESSFIYLNCV